MTPISSNTAAAYISISWGVVFGVLTALASDIARWRCYLEWRIAAYYCKHQQVYALKHASMHALNWRN